MSASTQASSFGSFRPTPPPSSFGSRFAFGRSVGVISCLTIYELEKQGLRGLIARQSAEILVEELPVLCRVVWLSDSALLRRAAQVAHGNGLAMADAVILVSLMNAGVDTIYTTDSDLEQYRAGPSIHRL